MKKPSIILLMFPLILTACNLNISKSGVSVSCPADRSAMEFSGGDGSSTKPYLICDELDLAELDQKLTDATLYTQYGDKFYQQIADINLKSETKSFLPLGMIDSPPADASMQTIFSNVPSSRPFKGTYDGKGLKISGLKIANSSPEAYLGLFHHIGDTGVVKNLTFVSPVLDLAEAYVAGTVAGYSSGVIDHVTVLNLQGTLDVGGYFGGVVGLVIGPHAKVSHVTTSGSITGGLNPSYNAGTDTFRADTILVSGIVGIAANVVQGDPLELTQLTNKTNILAGSYTAGVSAFVLGEVNASYLRNDGDIESRLTAGGVFDLLINGPRVGMAGRTLSIDHITNSGKVTIAGTIGNYPDVGGIAHSFDYGTGTYLYNSGEVINNHKVQGGAAGLFATAKNVTLSKVASVGNISIIENQTQSDGSTPANFGRVAGLIGTFETGDQTVGQVTIEDCYVKGHIKAGPDQQEIGGIISGLWNINDSLSLKRCYVASTFEGGKEDGGPVGSTDRGSVIGYIYAAPTLSTALTYSISDVFYASDLAPKMLRGSFLDISTPSTCDVITVAGGSCSISMTAKNASDFNLQSTFTGFDFNSVWNTPTASSYPTFK